MSLLDKILNRSNNGPVPVPTPEWPALDGTLFVRRLSPTERVEFDAESGKQQATSGAAFLTFTALYCLIAGDGSRAFGNNDWPKLVDDPGSGSAIDRAFDLADDLNTLSSGARDRLKKKYESVAGSASTSTSPATIE